MAQRHCYSLEHIKRLRISKSNADAAKKALCGQVFLCSADPEEMERPTEGGSYCMASGKLIDGKTKFDLILEHWLASRENQHLLLKWLRRACEFSAKKNHCTARCAEWYRIKDGAEYKFMKIWEQAHKTMESEWAKDAETS